MSLQCSVEKCKRKSTFVCEFCKKNLCEKHLKEHNDQLNSELNPLANEIKSLSNRYTSLDTNKLLNECYQKLDKWRVDSHKTIDRLYKQKREEVDRDWLEKLIKPQKDLDQIRSKFIEFTRKQKTTHEDINQSMEVLYYIDQQIKTIEQEIKDIKETGIPIDIIDQNSMSNKEPKLKNVEIFNLSSSYRTIDCSVQSGVAFAKNNVNLLIYEHHKFNLFNENLICIEQISWLNGKIYDICWSKRLNQFLIITDKRIVYLINEKPLSFKPIKSIEENKWWSCTSSDKYLFLSTHGTNPNIFQFDILSSFDFIKRWRSPQTCQQDESIHNINYINDTLLLIIGDSSNKTARIELRSSITLTTYWSLSIDISHISYQSTIHSCLFKSNQWIIIIENTTKIFLISEDGKLKETCEYQQPVWNALLFSPKLLAIRTENNINFHQI